MRPHRAPALLTALAALATLPACVDRSIEVAPDSGLEYTDVEVGNGLRAREGNAVEVHYTVSLPDGTTVIDTHDNGRSHRFTVGDGTVIVGLDLAVRGMREGGVRTARIPPESHYGRRGYAGVIPEDTFLNFRISMIDVRSSRW